MVFFSWILGEQTGSTATENSTESVYTIQMVPVDNKMRTSTDPSQIWSPSGALSLLALQIQGHVMMTENFRKQ